jgi:predicted 2-oxoglutarate/Fe(II)-dependent dioxygenase YbiX
MPVIDGDFLKWFIDAYGLSAALAIFVLWKSMGKSDTKRDVAFELITKIDSLTVNVQDVRERVAKIEGKLDAK